VETDQKEKADRLEVVKASASPLEITEFVSDANLREVCWNQRYLEKVSKDHSLRHRQAVVFCNAAQDRFRLVANFFGLAVLVLPPINPEDRISLYLKISQFLSKLSTPSAEVVNALRVEMELAHERIERRKKLAQAAAPKRKGR
jgi:hypothetical protein